MKKIAGVLFLFFMANLVFAQRVTVSGFVSDKETGEKLIGASVYIAGTTTGSATNTYGFYSLSLPAGKTRLAVRYVGYNLIEKEIDLTQSQTVDFILEPSVTLKTVEIVATKTEKIQESSQMSAIEIPISQIKSIPMMFGETDVLKAIQLLPGVHSGNEGSTGFYVRGGGPDQNLILLDDAPVYNASHLLGFFSVFNADAIRNVTLIKGGFPARYGGRLSSVLDIHMKEGNSKKISGEGSIGIVASRLTIEGPIFKDKTSFIVSARRTYIDLLTRPIVRAATKGAGSMGLYFYDLNAKINHKISEKDHLYLSLYTGKDVFSFKLKDKYSYQDTRYESSNKFGLDWGNLTSTLRWNHILSDKLFCNTSLIYSRYQFNVNIEMENKEINPDSTVTNIYGLEYLSGINDMSGKINFDYYPHPDHFIKFGAIYIYHTFHTGALHTKFQIADSTTRDTLGPKPLYATELGLYIEDDFKITDLVKINAGVHASGFIVKNTPYYSVQPRISGRYLFAEDWSLKGSFATMTQYIHLLSNYSVGLPTDLWVPSTPSVKPQQSWQVATGIARTLFNEQYELSIEGFYKEMKNLIEFKEGAGFLGLGGDWQNKIENGSGTSYGSEFFLQRKEGRITGWIGYTLSWTDRYFKNLNFGKPYPYKYDRRHDISVVFSYKLDKKTDISLTWVYGTGNAVTIEKGRYWGLDGFTDYYTGKVSHNELNYYGDRNSFRMGSYHRLDVGFNLRNEKKKGVSSWNLGFYNAYNRKNPYFMYFGNNDKGEKVAYQVSLFPIIPSISYSYKF